MKKRPGFTLEQHRALGTALREFRNGPMIKAAVDIPNAYGLNGREKRIAHRAMQAIDELRCLMDSLVFAEYPRLDTQTLAEIYYGDEVHRARRTDANSLC